MNYYPRHIGDYARDTGHLSLLEHGVYTVLLDHHYASEAGIPEGKQYRLARARTRKEREAVDNVLDEFFDLNDGIWINRRAHREVERYQAGLTEETGQRRGVAERQAKARARRRAMYEALGRHGVTPAFNASMQELRQILAKVTSRSAGRDVTAETGDVTRDVTAIQKPVTQHQQPKANKPEPAVLSVGDVTQDNQTEVKGEVFSAPVTSPVTSPQDPVIVACKALRQIGVTDIHPDLPNLRAAIEAGATPTHLVAIAKQHLAAGKRLNANYIANTARGQLQDAQRAPIHHPPAQSPPNKQEAIERRNRSVATHWAGRVPAEPAEVNHASE